MMRYQRVSPDYIPFSNGKKPSLRTSSTCKEDVCENGKTITPNGFESGYDGSKAFRFRSPSRTTTTTPEPPTSAAVTTSNGGATSSSPFLETNNLHSQRFDISPNRGDVLLQWGQKKRARLSRTEIHRSLNEDSSSSSSSILGRQPMNKVQRRGSGLMEKLSTPPLPPPPPPSTLPHTNGSTTSRASTLRSRETSGFIPNRNIEDRSANGSPSRTSGNISNTVGITRSISRSIITATATAKASASSSSGSRKDEKQLNGSLTRSAAAAAAMTNHHRHHHHHHHHGEPSGGVGSSGQENINHTSGVGVGVGGEKGNNNNSGSNVAEVLEWPKIYISLSRKEKEEDFLAMKGTKLPQRPKKRAKNVDRTLQYCFPGMWLSDLTKSRYEVREKKCVKKQKRRGGLKGMENMDTDSD